MFDSSIVILGVPRNYTRYASYVDIHLVMGDYDLITYTKHDETRLIQRGISKLFVESVLQTGISYVSTGAFIAEARLPNKDRLAIKIVFSKPAPRHAHVITIHLTALRRTRSLARQE